MRSFCFNRDQSPALTPEAGRTDDGTTDFTIGKKFEEIELVGLGSEGGNPGREKDGSPFELKVVLQKAICTESAGQHTNLDTLNR